MESYIRQNISPEFRDIYKRHWTTIKTSVKKGRIKDVYHYLLSTNDNTEIIDCLETTASNYNRKIKINAAFGFILRNKLTEELRFFHPSNNTMLLKLPRLIETVDDLIKLKQDMENDDIFEYIRTQRPTTIWAYEKVVCVRFDVFKMD